jgi:hypothetical protein
VLDVSCGFNTFNRRENILKVDSLLAQIVEFYKKGLIKAIAPMKVFEGAKVEDSFRS